MLGAEEAEPPNLNAMIRQIAPGFRFKAGESIEILESFRNEVALQTHPVSEKRSAQMYRNFSVPAGKKTMLKIRASYHPHGDWRMRVVVGRKVLLDQEVSYATVQDEWLESEVDLTAYAGTMVEIVLENVATGWNNEFGFWGKVELVSE